MEKGRSRPIDILRGLGIFLMVLGHYLHVPALKMWIYSFHMPLFFVVSGFFFPKDPGASFWPFLKKRAAALLGPYVFCGALLCLFCLFTSGVHVAREMALSLMFYNTSAAAKDAGTLWFLTALFFAETLFFFLSRALKRAPLLLTCFVLAVCGMFLGDNAGFARLPFALSPALVALFFLAVGFVLSASGAEFVCAPPPATWKVLVLEGALFLALCLVGFLECIKEGECSLSCFSLARYGMRTGDYPGGICFFLFSLVGICLAFWLCRALSLREENGGRYLRLVARFLSFLGENSLFYLLFSSFLGNRIQAVKDLLVDKQLRFPFSYFFIALQITLIFLFMWGIVWLFKKTPLSLLVCKKPIRKTKQEA